MDFMKMSMALQRARRYCWINVAEVKKIAGAASDYDGFFSLFALENCCGSMIGYGNSEVKFPDALHSRSV